MSENDEMTDDEISRESREVVRLLGEVDGAPTMDLLERAFTLIEAKRARKAQKSMEAERAEWNAAALEANRKFLASRSDIRPRSKTPPEATMPMVALPDDAIRRRLGEVRVLLGRVTDLSIKNGWHNKPHLQATVSHLQNAEEQLGKAMSGITRFTSEFPKGFESEFPEAVAE
jgi:hypothetical protein